MEDTDFRINREPFKAENTLVKPRAPQQSDNDGEASDTDVGDTDSTVCLEYPEKELAEEIIELKDVTAMEFRAFLTFLIPLST